MCPLVLNARAVGVAYLEIPEGTGLLG